MKQANLKKVNLIPKSVSLDKTLKKVQIVVAILCLLSILAVSGVTVSQIFVLKGINAEIDDANAVINKADFATLENLKIRYESLLAASDAGNFNTIPNVYEDMTDFLSCVMKNKPDTMTLESIDGDFNASGVYSYSFSFKSTERNTIPTFLAKLQNEEILKYINVSAITSEDGDETSVDSNSNSEEIANNAVSQNKDGTWKFTLVIKTKGGER